eukprot:TRINITY_DN3956_c0_g2_i1.p1 TRINITY_DN3956_c0_g2~~TRINITY_DN3956_c0_g2_i1.p1  ORF type:complete len:261 (-),score=54.23 TRINITY_DN3956_c0_g2_i1:122-904(-)
MVHDRGGPLCNVHLPIIMEIPGFPLTVGCFAGLGAAQALACVASIGKSTLGVELPVLARLLKLEKDREAFWQPLLEEADRLRVPEAVRLCMEVQRVVPTLPNENGFVRTTLLESAERLQRASEAVLSMSANWMQAAQGGLADSGRDLVESVFKHIANEQSDLLDRSEEGEARRNEALPALRCTAAGTSDILEDCRLASRGAFDVLKYDIYNRDVPKTPEEAKSLADRLVQASGETRHSFTSFVTVMAQGLTRDALGDVPT